MDRSDSRAHAVVRACRIFPCVISSARGLTDACCDLWCRTDYHPWQRCAGARLAFSPNVADGRYRSGSACGPTAAGCPQHKHYRAGCAARAIRAKSEHRSADCAAQAGCTNSAECTCASRHGCGGGTFHPDCGAGVSAAATALQCGGLYRGLFFVPRVRLYLSAEQRAAQAVHQTSPAASAIVPITLRPRKLCRGSTNR
jgi:hypothetical protein